MPPVSTFVFVSRLVRPDWLFEIDAMAVIGSGNDATRSVSPSEPGQEATRMSSFADFRIRAYRPLQLDGQCPAALFPAAAGNG